MYIPDFKCFVCVSLGKKTCGALLYLNVKNFVEYAPQEFFQTFTETPAHLLVFLY